MSVLLRKFIPFSPEEILAEGPYSDWILLILFCGLFIAISGAVLPKHLTEKRYGKAVVVFTGLILGIGLFKAHELYNFNLESFGFLAIWLIVLIMGFVTYGLTKIGIAKTTAISVTYCVMFLSFFLLSPSLFDSISESFPLVNLLFLLGFFYMLGKPLFSMLSKNNPLKAAKKLQNTNFSLNDVEIDREVEENKTELKDVKTTVLATKKELKSVSEIDKLLSDILKIIKEKGTQLTEEDKKIVSDDLKRINRNENILLTQAMEFIHSHMAAYNKHHKRDLNEIQQRLNKTRSKKQIKILQDELNFHKTMIEVIAYIDSAESKQGQNFIQYFNELLSQAINRLTNNNPGEALSYLQAGHKNLIKFNQILKKVKSLERWFIKADKTLIKDLKKEKKVSHKG